MPSDIVLRLIKKVDDLSTQISELKTDIAWIKKIGYAIGGATLTALAKMFIHS